MDRACRSLILNGATLGPSSSGDIAAFEGYELSKHVLIEGIGATGLLPALCRDMMRELGWERGPEVIIAVIGPGSFTGLRASLALANGLALGFGARLRGVTIGACFRMRPAWQDAICLTQARRDRIFAEWPDGHFWAGAPEALAVPPDMVVLGAGVEALSETHPAREHCVHALRPEIEWILEAGLQSSDRETLLPLYVDAPEAKLPARGLRPAPRS